jgi:hypothetical protein
MMEKFDFLIGNWDLEYRVPLSRFSPAATGAGAGSFKRALGGRYVCFDYSMSLSTGETAEAHGIFAWDEKVKVYRYWWFESSGSFLTATCGFADDQTLLLNWHDTLLTQTFTRIDPRRVVLRMQHPNARGEQETVLEVLFTKAQPAGRPE